METPTSLGRWLALHCVHFLHQKPSHNYMMSINSSAY